MLSIIKPRGDTKANWESVNPVLRVREWGVEWEKTIGIGEIKVKIGDGATPWNLLEYAIINNVTKKVVKNFAVVSAENPDLVEGSTMDMLWAVTKRKFEFVVNKVNTMNTLIGVFKNVTIVNSKGTAEAVTTITDAIKKLDSVKLTTANIYDGTDSTNTALALSANRGRLLQAAINQLNGEIVNKLTTRKIYFKEYNFNVQISGNNEAKGNITFKTAFGDPSKFGTLYWTIRQNYTGGTYYQNVDIDVRYDMGASRFDYVLYNNNANTYTVPCKLLILVIEL